MRIFKLGQSIIPFLIRLINKSYDEMEVLGELMNEKEFASNLKRLLNEKPKMGYQIETSMNMHGLAILEDSLPPKSLRFELDTMSGDSLNLPDHRRFRRRCCCLIPEFAFDLSLSSLDVDDIDFEVYALLVFVFYLKFDSYRILQVTYQEGRCASKVGRKGIQKNVSKASKGKEKVVVGNKKWTKQAIKLSKSPSKKGTKRETSDNLCKFRLWGSWMQNEASFQIKTLIPDHNCARVFNFGALVTYKWIARHYVREIVSNPKISHRELQAAIREKFLINVSLGQVRRAKQRALYDFEGGLIEHYGKLWDYRDQLLKTNPGSTVKFDVDEVSGGKTYFKRFYVCFKAMKHGWTAGCRKVIGLDGCFLKGTINGELLTAMGRDANNQMFPIAWAVVTVENKDNWLWFLVSLGDDLNLNRGATVTIILKKTKGLKIK
ncbi:hypothetical protein Tco_0996992 [Tanacetum coccineum]